MNKTIFNQAILFFVLFIVFTWGWMVFFQGNDTSISSEIFEKYYSYSAFIYTFILLLFFILFSEWKNKKQLNLIVGITVSLFFTNFLIFLYKLFFDYEFESQVTDNRLIYITNQPSFLKALWWGILTNIFLIVYVIIYEKKWYLGFFFTIIVSFCQLFYFHYLFHVMQVIIKEDRINIEYRSLITESYEYPLQASTKVMIKEDYSVKYGKGTRGRVINYYELSLFNPMMEETSIVSGIPQSLIPKIHPFLDKLNKDKQYPIISNPPKNYRVFFSSDTFYVEKSPAGLEWYFWLMMVVAFLVFTFISILFSSFSLLFTIFMITIVTFMLGYNIYENYFVYTHLTVTQNELKIFKKPYSLFPSNQSIKSDGNLKIRSFSIVKSDRGNNFNYFLRIHLDDDKFCDTFQDEQEELEKLKAYLEQNLENSKFYQK